VKGALTALMVAEQCTRVPATEILRSIHTDAAKYGRRMELSTVTTSFDIVQDHVQDS
jgi:hypothetical protein